MWPSEYGALAEQYELFGGTVPYEDVRRTYAEHLEAITRAPLEEAISRAYVEGYAIPKPQLGEDVYAYLAETPEVTYIPTIREIAEQMGLPVYQPPSAITVPEPTFRVPWITEEPVYTYTEQMPVPGPGSEPAVVEAGLPFAGAIGWIAGLTSLVITIGGLWSTIQALFGGDGGMPQYAAEDLVNQIPYILR
jgi:hypothetical protein